MFTFIDQNNLAMKKIVLLFLVLLLGFGANKFKQVQKRPNVLFLFIDDLRPELPSFGASHIQAPNIDALAKKGITFTNAYCNVPVCGASRASMLTGMLPTKDRFLDYKTFVEEETPWAITLPQLFKKSGYTTISNGKIYHHLDDRETDWNEVWRPYAFDKNDKGLAPTDYWQSLWKDYQTPANRDQYQKTDNGPAYEKASVLDSVYIDGLLTQKVLRDLKKLKKSKKPFFLTAGFISPHLPFNAPKKYWDLYKRSNIKQPENYNYIPENAPAMSISNWQEMRSYDNIPKQGQVSDSIAIDLIHGYYATVSYTDALIGKILEGLKQQALDDNTVVVLVSDHGYNLQEHTQWSKFTNYNTSTQVPLIIYNPQSKVKGSTDALTELVDIYPTLVEICGLKAPKKQLDGSSLVPILNNTALKGKQQILIKRTNGFTLKTNAFSYTEYINPDGHKVMTKMLYDHRRDKDENVNVVNHPALRDKAAELSNILHLEYERNIKGQ